MEILLFDGLLAMLPTEHANQIFEYSSLLTNTNIRDIAMLRSQVFANTSSGLHIKECYRDFLYCAAVACVADTCWTTSKFVFARITDNKKIWMGHK